MKNYISPLVDAIDDAVADIANDTIDEAVSRLISAGFDPLVIADSCLVSALALASAKIGDDLSARKMLVQWHALTESFDG